MKKRTPSPRFNTTSVQTSFFKPAFRSGDFDWNFSYPILELGRRCTILPPESLTQKS